MTKDLALAIHGSNLKRDHYHNTEEFINHLESKLRVALLESYQSRLSKG